MIRHIVIGSLLLGLALMALPALADMGGPPPDLSPLSNLVGDWKGTGPDGKAVTVTYRLTSHGSALTETIQPEAGPVMTTMYHQSGKGFMMTHYCALNNQPRMKAKPSKAGDKAMTFSFVDATNLKNPKKDLHMHQLTLEFPDQDHLAQRWTARKDGKNLPPHVFTLERVKEQKQS
jgi:hypothetical protein